MTIEDGSNAPISSSPALERVRSLILGELHLGHLRAGDRLPSVRELSRQLAVDHRGVARAYHALAAEGLVELRGRAGAFLASQERIGGTLPGETARWLGGVLAEARRRRIAVREFPRFVEAYLTRVRPRCLCLESNEDAMLALTLELEEEFGFDVVPLRVEALAPGGRRRGRAAGRDVAAGIDLVVTSAFHVSEARMLAEGVRKPLVVVTVGLEMSRLVERRIAAGPLTVLVADPAYGARFRAIYRTAARTDEDIRVVAAGDASAVARLDRLDPVLATRAARRLCPDLDVPLLLPRYPSISAESARDLIDLAIRINAEQGKA